VTAWNLDARNAAAFTLATRFEMRPDDIVFVAPQPITTWNRALQQLFPTLINLGATAAN
jgi:polysaccharide export outer membrane protein